MYCGYYYCCWKILYSKLQWLCMMTHLKCSVLLLRLSWSNSHDTLVCYSLWTSHCCRSHSSWLGNIDDYLPPLVIHAHTHNTIYTHTQHTHTHWVLYYTLYLLALRMLISMSRASSWVPTQFLHARWYKWCLYCQVVEGWKWPLGFKYPVLSDQVSMKPL